MTFKNKTDPAPEAARAYPCDGEGCSKTATNYFNFDAYGQPSFDPERADKTLRFCPRCFYANSARSVVASKAKAKLDAHPEWRRQKGEPKSDYHERAMLTARALIGKVITPLPYDKSRREAE